MTSINSNQFTFNWITDWNTIYSEQFQQHWLKWVETAENSHVFFHPALCMAWLDTYRPLRKLVPIFCIAQIGENTIFFPLVLWHKNWKNAFQKVIVPVGYCDFDYHDPLVIGFETTILSPFFIQLTQELNNHFVFDKIEINGIRNSVLLSNWVEESEFCPYCDLSGFTTGDEFLRSLKTSLRGDLNRQMRRMEEKGEISLFTYTELNLQQAISTLPQFLKHHSYRWPKSYKAPDFHKNIINWGIPTTIVDFTELQVGGITVSWHLGFHFKNRYYYYMPAIDFSWQKFSPGKVHLYKLVERAIFNQLELFDHLRGDENYKSGWSSQIQSMFQFSYYTENFAGILRNRAVDIRKYLNK